MPDGSRPIDRATVEEFVVDRGEENVWDVINAIEDQRLDRALALLRRYLDSSNDRARTRFSFLSLLAGRCQQLIVVHGVAMTQSLPDVSSFAAFRSRVLRQLTAEMPPAARKTKPYPLFRIYRAAMARSSPEMTTALADLPWRILETEVRLRDGASDGDLALEALVGVVAGGGARSRPAGRGRRRH